MPEHLEAESPDRLEFRFDLTSKDFDAFARYAKTHQPDGKPKPRTSPYVWVWLAVMFGFPITLSLLHTFGGIEIVKMREAHESERVTWPSMVDEDAPPNPDGSRPGRLRQYIPLLTIVGAFIGLIFIGRIMRRRALLRHWANDPELRNRLCRLSGDGVMIGSAGVSTAYRWSKMVRLVLTEQHLVFFLSPTQADLLPRRAIGDVDQTIRTLAHIRKWYSGSVIDVEGKPITAASSLHLE